MVRKGFCHCGCGRKTNIAKVTHQARGWVRGQPHKFLQGHRARRHGKKNSNWKGGRSKHSEGYPTIYVEGRGHVLEHRLIAQEMLGRELKPGEIVRFKNGNRRDLRPRNLEVMTRSEFMTRHGPRSKRKS